MRWLLLLSTVLLSCPPICGQLPPRLERCLPLPTLAEEIRQMQEEASHPEEARHPKVTIDGVTFEGPIHLPKSVTAKIVAPLAHNGFDADNPDWIRYVEEKVRETWQDHGYLLAKASANTRVLSSRPTEQRVSLSIRVDEGRRFRLGEIGFTGAKAFPREELRKQIALRDGDVFNRRKITEGIEALTRLYGSHGYINFTATPEMHVDNARQRISLVLDIQEDKQFRVGSVEVLGLDPKIANRLKMRLRPGDIFNTEMVERLFNENRSVIPADVSPKEDTEVRQNRLNGTVSIVFDFRGCPWTP